MEEEEVVEAKAEEGGKAGVGTGVKAGEKDILGWRVLSLKEKGLMFVLWRPSGKPFLGGDGDR